MTIVEDTIAIFHAGTAAMRNTLWEDRDSRIRTLRSVGAAFLTPPIYRSEAKRRSPVENMRTQGHAIRAADERLFNAARQVWMRERRRCAEIAAKYSPQAAEEIRSLPEIPEWSAEG